VGLASFDEPGYVRKKHEGFFQRSTYLKGGNWEFQVKLILFSIESVY